MPSAPFVYILSSVFMEFSKTFFASGTKRQPTREENTKLEKLLLSETISASVFARLERIFINRSRDEMKICFGLFTFLL